MFEIIIRLEYTLKKKTKILSQNSPIKSPIQHMLGIISAGGFQISLVWHRCGFCRLEEPLTGEKRMLL